MKPFNEIEQCANKISCDNLSVHKRQMKRGSRADTTIARNNGFISMIDKNCRGCFALQANEGSKQIGCFLGKLTGYVGDYIDRGRVQECIHRLDINTLGLTKDQIEVITTQQGFLQYSGAENFFKERAKRLR